MKKSVLLISAAAIVASCGLGACSSKKSGGNGDYDNLNEMLTLDYSQIVLTVTETFDDESNLKSEYIIKYSESEITVEYSVERFSPLSLDAPSSGFKTTYNGTATIMYGTITGGEEVGLTADIANPKFNFKKSYFENATLTSIAFNADVKNVSGFLGLDVTCTDMKVSANFIGFYEVIGLSYNQDGVKVEYTYEFSL